MIIIEAICRILELLFYYTTRPIIWIITARDCRHCKHGRWCTGSKWYYDPFGWYCGKSYIPDVEKCLNTPWRCKFERKK